MLAVLLILAKVWLAGSVLLALVTAWSIVRERTAHGRGLLIVLGCGFTLLWPLFLLLVVLVGIVLGLWWLAPRFGARS